MRSSTPHSISRPTIAASTSTFGSSARAFATAASRSAQSATRLMPTDEPARAGLTNTGSPSRSRSASVRRVAAAAQHHGVADREPGVAQQALGDVLVHRRRAGADPGADVGHAGHLEQPLDGAVLAAGAVQDGDDDVDAAERAAVVERDELAARRVGGQRDGPPGRDLGQLAAVQAQHLGVGGAEHPLAGRA